MTEFRLHEPIRRTDAVERIGEVIRAIQEKDGTIHAIEILRGIELAQPAFSRVRRHSRQRPTFPNTVLSKKAATINRHRRFKTAIEACNNAGQVAAPANARNSWRGQCLEK